MLGKQSIEAAFIFINEEFCVESMDFDRKKWSRFFYEDKSFKYQRKLDYYMKDLALLDEVEKKLSKE